MLEGLGLVFGELSGFDELVDERLVFRDEAQAAVPKEVTAAVADLSDEENFVDEARNRGRRAHTTTCSVFLCGEEDPRAGFFDRRDQAPREVVTVCRSALPAQGFEQGVDRHVACHLAGCRAAHAVTHGKCDAAIGDRPRDLFLLGEGPRLAGEVGDHVVVFVVLANQPDVGFTVDAEVEPLGGRDHRGLRRPAPALHARLRRKRLADLVHTRPTVTIMVCVTAHSAPDCIRCPTQTL